MKKFGAKWMAVWPSLWVLWGLTGSVAIAQGFPTKPITIVVPYAPGATDREARKIAELAAKHLGQTIVVENRDGAGGTIGAAHVARSSPMATPFCTQHQRWSPWPLWWANRLMPMRT